MEKILKRVTAKIKKKDITQICFAMSVNGNI